MVPHRLLRLMLVGAILSLFGPAAYADAPASQVTITILHTNDMHGHLEPEVDKNVAPTPSGGAAYLAALIQKMRAANPKMTLLIDSGDIAQGTPISNMFQGRPMVEFMNDLGYDAGTIGNHEFDWGPAALAAMIRGAKRPIVCANLIETSTGKAPAGVKRFIVKQVGDVKVGITGLVTPSTPGISFKQNVAPFRFLDETEALKAVLPEMKAAGAQVIIVSSHLGEKADRALAAAVPGVNVIVGGHSHTPIHEPAFVNGTVIVQAGKYMRYLGKLDVTIDRNTWKVVDYTRKDELIPVLDADIKPDPKVAAMVKKYHDQVGPAMDQVLGQAADDLNRNLTPGFADTSLGDVVTDAMRWKVHSDVAVYNSGGIRTDFNKGPIKMGDVYTLLPFDNYLVVVTLTGEQIQRLVAQGLGDGQKTMQVSGLTFAIGPDGKATDIKIDGKPLDPTRKYRVSTVDFLAEGNDGLTVFKEVKDRVYDELARDVFTAYVRKSSPLSAPKPGRITRASAQ